MEAASLQRRLREGFQNTEELRAELEELQAEPSVAGETNPMHQSTFASNVSVQAKRKNLKLTKVC